jgi:vitamin B12 transporter
LLLDNWILWQPGVDGLFRPDNLRQVWSRGFETNTSAQRQSGQWQIRASIRYQFTQATNTKVYGGSAAVLDMQLPYTPKHNASTEIAVQHRRYGLQYIHQWTGKRFTTSDNSLSLPGFDTAVLLASCKLGRRGHFTIRLDNCWNQAYQMVAFRPMPGRNWNAGYLHRF